MNFTIYCVCAYVVYVCMCSCEHVRPTSGVFLDCLLRDRLFLETGYFTESGAHGIG